MTGTAIILLLIAAATHAGWNLLSKHRHPSAAFFLLANTAGAALLLPVAAVHWRAVAKFPVTVWWLLVVTGLFQAIYYQGLAGAYRHGELSIAYPLARSTPVILVTVVSLLLGRGDQLTVTSLVGMALVVVGCLVLPMKHFRDLRFRNYLNLSCGLALVAAAGTAGYSMVDDAALRVLRGSPGVLGDHRILTTLTFACFEAVAASVWLAVMVWCRPSERVALRRLLAAEKRVCAAAGGAIYLTYGIVLIAMGYVADVSYVVAFRQLSIPLGAILGIVLLHESGYAPKYVGMGICFAGLVLVGLG